MEKVVSWSEADAFDSDMVKICYHIKITIKD